MSGTKSASPRPRQCRRLLHRPGPRADHGGHADRAGRGSLVEGPLLADGAGHALSRGQDRRPEVARRIEQDPAQAFPGRAPDHRRRQRALGVGEPADPHPALRRGRPLSVQRRQGDPVNLAKKRTVTFWNRKIVLVSTPTIRGLSRIETAYAESDQRQYWEGPACVASYSAVRATTQNTKTTASRVGAQRVHPYAGLRSAGSASRPLRI